MGVGMRITESMLTGYYTRNLQRNISNLAQSNLKLSSEREYNHVSEDPARAAKAFAVRDQIALSEEHIRTVKSAMGELDTADKNIQSINSILQTVFEKATKAGGVTNQENLNAIAEELHGLNEEILQTMNARYGDKYLFSGSGNEEAPFTVDGGRLFFNGKAVDDYDQDDPDTYFDNNKEVYLDVGFGAYGSGAVNAKTGVKISTSGVDVLGYGTKDGQPNNIYSLISQIEGQLRSGNTKDAMDTLEHLKDKQNNISIATAEIGTRETLLDRAQDRLEGGLVNLKERQKDLEAVDLAGESINNKAYEAAWMVTLQLGSSLIPPSIFDFMK